MCVRACACLAGLLARPCCRAVAGLLGGALPTNQPFLTGIAWLPVLSAAGGDWYGEAETGFYATKSGKCKAW